MEIAVINIGNSKGIRLPKAILEQYNITDSLEMILEKGKIILKPKSAPRKDWEKSFEQMNTNGDDQLLFDDVFEDETFEEWK
ncbi:MAG TPA: AbrB/MazE/SpoVT family DNA-binding domain-containing protein [Gelidibacter sp.]|uniref:AbrB/MazE/SpoVT family DNA-binding domain-containing protein n=1 Tax=Gelidibacter sp. TaxID=2018083 RepID=UPI002D1A5BA0|nr:AbrB/MazE/SpoVT family DNA-binding domain-containing protein [Gelidibacter sp.]HXK00215.1 AbrB/MazE/SpoVT family DNA-binding domain-containing protein [Gelidibacter sp.]